jgi:citrate lyase subunit alpha/citrate CoA-transferase
MLNAAGREIPDSITGVSAVKPYAGPFTATPAGRLTGPRIAVSKPHAEKVLRSLDLAIEAVGLRDGMTISFHHHFRNGDRVLNNVMAAIARKGIQGLTLAPSSLTDVNDAIIPYIEAGVVSAIETSGARGKLGAFLTARRWLAKPAVIRSHGGRARAIECGELHIDVAFIGAPHCDRFGNINGIGGRTACGSLGYAMVDAAYADKVVAITDHVVPQQVYPVSIPQTQVDFIVEVDSIGDPAGIATGAMRISRDPRELLIAEYAAAVIEHSGVFRDGYSLQLGSGGASLAVGRFIRDKMVEQGITGSFGVGGISAPFVELLEQGLFEVMYDTQSFDVTAIESLQKNPNHIEIDASFYANPHSRGPIVNCLDAVILSATEVDTDFNVNVITNSNGVIMGASGGHSDTAAGAQLAIVVAPLIRGRLPIVLDRVHTVVTPGETVDVVVTERGIAVNPRRIELADRLKAAKLPVMDIHDLQHAAEEMTGKPDPVRCSDEVVALVEYRDGTVLDVVRRPLEHA